MKLTIITINYNNASGLQKTMESVFVQTSHEFEYIVIDGTVLQLPKGEVAGDREVFEHFIKETYETENGFTRCSWLSPFGGVEGGFYSEPDSGIYHAMNKGIRMAKGEYVQFLNSGDFLVTSNVIGTMIATLPDCSIYYGNMLKQLPNGKLYRDTSGQGSITMFTFYKGALNHSPAFIKRSLFEKYGLYDENLKIVSDWKWYLNVVGLHNESVKYTNLDVTVFDMTGISSTNSKLEKHERKLVLAEILPASVLSDYERWTFPIDQMKRINRYWVTRKGFWLVERILFKWEKWFRNKEQLF